MGCPRGIEPPYPLPQSGALTTELRAPCCVISPSVYQRIGRRYREASGIGRSFGEGCTDADGKLAGLSRSVRVLSLARSALVNSATSRRMVVATVATFEVRYSPTVFRLASRFLRWATVSDALDPIWASLVLSAYCQVCSACALVIPTKNLVISLGLRVYI